MQSQTFTTEEISHIATLANIPVDDKERTKLAAGFTKTMHVVDNLSKANTKKMAPTHDVTGLSNITRVDEVDETRTFTQSEALRNAKNSFDGYFVVDQVIER